MSGRTGNGKKPFPRHPEINEKLARAILRRAARAGRDN